MNSNVLQAISMITQIANLWCNLQMIKREVIGCYKNNLAALLVMWIGYAWFQKTRNGFANVF